MENLQTSPASYHTLPRQERISSLVRILVCFCHMYRSLKLSCQVKVYVSSAYERSLYLNVADLFIYRLFVTVE